MLYGRYTIVCDWDKVQEEIIRLKVDVRKNDTQYNFWIKLLVSSLRKVFKSRSSLLHFQKNHFIWFYLT